MKLFSRSRGSINGDIVVGQPMKHTNCCAVHRGAIASFVSGGFTTMTVINPPEKTGKTHLCVVEKSGKE